MLSDIDTLLDFEQGVIAAERPFDVSIKPDHVTYYNLEKLITGDDSLLLVAEENGILVGSGYALIMNSKPFEIHAKFSYLGFMFVDPNHRRKGINKLIIDDLIEWSKSKGMVEIRLDVFDKNEPAVRAYEKIGFSKTLVKMRMDIK